MTSRFPSHINYRQLFNGRHVYVANGKWIDYFPSGCGLRVEVIGGMAYYTDKRPTEIVRDYE